MNEKRGGLESGPLLVGVFYVYLLHASRDIVFHSSV